MTESETPFPKFSSGERVEAGEAAELKSDQGAKAASGPIGSEAVLRIPVRLQVLLGVVQMPVSRLMQLSPGSTLALDRKVGDPVDIEVNGRLVARGEILVLDKDGGQLGVKVTEIAEAGRPPAA